MLEKPLFEVYLVFHAAWSPGKNQMIKTIELKADLVFFIERKPSSASASQYHLLDNPQIYHS